ncbi:plasmid partitioning protein RepB C-terminal domain-containing protein [Acinetobacter sp.]|uniref:plasmid partitioning protein RepB C-terminal domain-containing protein n=1 Tax=Acinetobacter sp. TaxID=472 RepID=UPI002FDA9BEB
MKTNKELTIKASFIPSIYLIDIDRIVPLKKFPKEYKLSKKYHQILQSVKNIGLVEPLIVYPSPQKPDSYLLMDGHSRLLALQACEQTQAKCIISTEDDTFTYNNKVNRLASIQSVNMIINAVNIGVPISIISQTLNISEKTIRGKFNLLTGICEEVIKILSDQHVSMGVFPILRKMKKLRQIDAATGMKTKQDFSVKYARFLLDSSAEHEIHPLEKKKSTVADRESNAQLQREISNLRVKQKNKYDTFATDSFKLTIIKPFIKELLNNVEIVKWLAKHKNEYLLKFNEII